MASSFGLSRCASCSLFFISNSHKCRNRVAPVWRFGRPDSSSFSWLFVPLIRCALGLDPADEAISSLAGVHRWNAWVAAYREDFKSRRITPSSLPFGPDGYLDHTHQVRLLLGPAASGASNVSELRLCRRRFDVLGFSHAEQLASVASITPRPPPSPQPFPWSRTGPRSRILFVLLPFLLLLIQLRVLSIPS